jgi:hypothetical protein
VAQQDLQVLKVFKVLPVLQDQVVVQDLLDLQVLKVQQDPQVH